MNDNKSAFDSSDYDGKIKQILPYYEQFYKQIQENLFIWKSGKGSKQNKEKVLQKARNILIGMEKITFRFHYQRIQN